jgi:peptide/nickel transport system substrate-binding protein
VILPARRTPIVLLAALLTLVAACRPERPDDELVVAVDAPVKDLDPRLATDGPSARLSRLVFEGLTRVDDHGLAQLDLAAELTPVGLTDSKGLPLQYRATLRPDARFANGQPVTPADVVCTYSSVLGEVLKTPIAGEFRKRFTAVVADPDHPNAVLFVLRKPLATLGTDLVLGIVPASVCGQPGQRFAGPLVGSGPWQVAADSLASGDRVAVSRWTGHRSGPPVPGQPRRLVFRAIADEGARALSVLGGGADVAWTGLSPSVLRSAETTGKVSVVTAPGIGWMYLGLNLRHPPLYDVRVREALALALDRDSALQSVLGGRGRLAEGMFPPEHWAHVALPPRPRDLQRAAALLDAAGLLPGPDGVRLRLTVKVSTSRLRRALARHLAEGLRPLGIDVTVRPFELATFLADVRAGQFEVFLLQLPEPVEPDQLGWMFASTNAAVAGSDPASASPYARWDRRGLPWATLDPDLTQHPTCGPWQAVALPEALQAFALAPLGLAEPRGAANRTAYANTEVDCLVDAGRRELDRSKRAALYGRVQQILAEELPVLPLWWESVALVVGPRWQVPAPASDGRYAGLAAARRLP